MTTNNKKWQDHEGLVIASVNDFDVIDCRFCGFKHIIPIPTEHELAKVYHHEYYSQEKPLYIERDTEDLDWWNLVYTQRYEILEQYLPINQRRLLDIGSGPGFFLLNGQKRGWQVKGVEPSHQAVKHSRELGLEVEQIFYSEQSASLLGSFDVINMSMVLEHLPDPKGLLQLAYNQLNDNGMVCIVVPNDFNPFQIILRDHLDFKPWWIAPPHHINYFDFDSLANLLKMCGFQVVHKESTFPIDMFLLMGDNYIGNDELGRKCHEKRMNFEKAINLSGSESLLAQIYASFANQGIGREINIFAKKT